MSEIEITREEYEELKQLGEKLNQIDARIAQLMNEMAMLRETRAYLAGQKDMLLRVLSLKYGFDPTKPIEIDEVEVENKGKKVKRFVLRVREAR